MESNRRVSFRSSPKTLLALICVYLLGVPIVTSLNGLSLHIFGISSVGPLYHTLFSLLLIWVGLTDHQVEKNHSVLMLVFGSFVGIVGAQLVLGFSDFAFFDLGQLYKWYMPLMLFAVYYRWSYLRELEAHKWLARVFLNVPLIYSVLIFFSVFTFVAFGFNPSLFEPGTLRFTGFAFGYNTTVNAILICAYVNFILLPTTIWRKGIYAISFVAMNSKTALLYFGLIGLSFLVSVIRLHKANVLVILSPILIALLLGCVFIGYQLTSLAPYARFDFESLEQGDVASFALDFLGARRWYWDYTLSDVPNWPTANLILGNGLNVDRRLAPNSTWEELVGSRIYGSAVYTKENKTHELDGIGALDLFGVWGALIFAGVFYLYPFFAVRQPYFKIYQAFLVLLSLAGGHVINNPQTATLLVFLILFLRNYRPWGVAVAQPAKDKTIGLLNRAALGPVMD